MKFHHILLSTLALFAVVALSACSTITPAQSASDATMICGPGTTNPTVGANPSLWTRIESWFVSAEKSPAVAAIKAQTEALLQKFVFTSGAKKLTGASWADSFSAGIYASENELADNPILLNTFLGTFLPPDTQWTPVIDRLVAQLISGQLNTKAQRIAALESIAATLNAQAAAQRAP